MPRRIEGRGDGLGAQEEGEVDKVEEVEERRRREGSKEERNQRRRTTLLMK